jgi:hypothetical protein
LVSTEGVPVPIETVSAGAGEDVSGATGLEGGVEAVGVGVARIGV